MKKVYLMILFIGVLIVSGCQQGGNGTTTTTTYTTVTMPARVETVNVDIDITDAGFNPNTIEVLAGRLVLLTVHSIEGQHSITLNDYNINLDMPEGRLETVQFVSDKVGTFEFYDKYNPQFTGELTVIQP